MKNLLGNTIAKRLLIVIYNHYGDYKNNYAGKLIKEIDCTTSSLNKVIIYLENIGILESYVNGRKKMLKLTEKGRIIARALRDIQEVLG